MYYDFLRSFQANHTSPFTGILHAVAHLPLLALELLLNLQHHQGADPCTVALYTLVLTTGATALHFHTVSVSYARNSDYLFHNFNFQLFIFQFSIFNFQSFQVPNLLLLVIYQSLQLCHLGLKLLHGTAILQRFQHLLDLLLGHRL